MARTLDQIIKEIGSPYGRQIKNLKQRAADIPGQIKAEQAGLEATQKEAFGEILGGARRRGIGFSGIPLGEQAQYTATQFLPAVARLKQTGREQAMSLQDAISGIQQQRNQYAQSLRQAELNREEAARQAAATRAAAASAAAAQSADLSRYFQQQAPQQQKAPAASVVQKAPGSFAFFDAKQNPITAGQYALKTNQDIRDVLYEMGQQGDAGAAQVYNILRVTPDQQLNNALNQLSRNYGHIVGGYVTNGMTSPIGGR